ncbi:uroporphyrinogen-III C-methyltransferase [Crenobacter caeni]|uniref:uroporphyrinogen-III C-methyltransferase n=1 Tax=Crenobacter caeni TaxID=2705474 RepID=A0A6B2KVJ7_9NEIS|nr:uroporphyrinogen-III C-methyltransferase [Crenobacter caeni]NDV14029.1 uroporphyrinogen-III C-methyltransferase [Crenobacter caeni]
MEQSVTFSGWSNISSQPPGSVSLVGAGPGDPGLLTLVALRRLEEADAVFYDLLVDEAILKLAKHARMVCVGKRASTHTMAQAQIHAELVAAAQRSERVVRLKGGDPFMFGRGGEEIDALGDAGIKWEVVPGISAALGAAASCGIPLTHRDHAQSCRFVTGHRRNGLSNLSWALHGDEDETLVIYMGIGEASAIVEALLAAGRSPMTPVAVVENATRLSERCVRTVLSALPLTLKETGIKPPSLLFIGSIAGHYPKGELASS